MSWGDIKMFFATILVFKYNYVFVALIFAAMLVKSMTANVDDVDIGSKEHRVLNSVLLADSTGSGFEVHFASAHAITEERGELLSMKPDIHKFYDQLSTKAFDIEWLSADPYDVVDLMKSVGVPDSIKAFYIVGTGSLKHKLYLRPNPKDSSMSTKASIDIPNQGMVFLNENDIASYDSNKPLRPYNYIRANWNQPVLSQTDEKYTHIHYYEVVK